MRGTLQRVLSQLGSEKSIISPHTWKTSKIQTSWLASVLNLCHVQHWWFKTHSLTKTSLTSIAISLSCDFVPDETQCLPSSARTYPFAQEHITSFCTLFLMLQNCSQSPLFILQYFGMTIKEVSLKKKTTVSKHWLCRSNKKKLHSSKRICSSPVKHLKPIKMGNSTSGEILLMPYKATTFTARNVFAKPMCTQWLRHSELQKALAFRNR